VLNIQAIEVNQDANWIKINLIVRIIVGDIRSLLQQWLR
jgi:hypothetical protein